MTYIERQYHKFFDKHRYYPKVFEPYNARDCGDIHPTLTASSYPSAACAGGC